MTKEQNKKRLGAGDRGRRRFEVEWCSSIPRDENGDSDMDRAVYETRNFPSLGLAAAFGRSLIKDMFGCVTIEEQTVQLNQDVWEHERWQLFQWDRVNRWVIDDSDGEPIESRTW